MGSFDKNREIIREYLSKMDEVGLKLEMLHLTAHFNQELLMNFAFRKNLDNVLKDPKMYNLDNQNANQVSMLIRIMDRLNLYNSNALALLEVYLERNLYQLDIEDAIGLLHMLSKYKLGSTDMIVSQEKHIGLNRDSFDLRLLPVLFSSLQNYNTLKYRAKIFRIFIDSIIKNAKTFESFDLASQIYQYWQEDELTKTMYTVLVREILSRTSEQTTFETYVMIIDVSINKFNEISDEVVHEFKKLQKSGVFISNINLSTVHVSHQVQNSHLFEEKFSDLKELNDLQEKVKSIYLSLLPDNKDHTMLIKLIQQYDDLWESDQFEDKEQFMKGNEAVLGAILKEFINLLDKYHFLNREHVVGIYSKFCMKDWDIIQPKLIERS